MKWKMHPFYPVKVYANGTVRLRLRGGPWARHPGTPDRDGYLRVSFHYDGAYITKFIHVLVLETWTGPRPRGAISRHLNGVNTDNRRKNLKWGTHAENSADRAAHGRTQRGQRHYRAKLTEANVRAILAAPQRHGIKTELARKYGVSDAMIGYIRRGESWKHVDAG